MPRLVFELAGAKVAMRSTRIVVGRSSGCDLQLDDDGVSRRHAEFVATDVGWSVQDLESANGTYVEGERIDRRVFVYPGLKVQLGKRGPVLTIVTIEYGKGAVAGLADAPLEASPKKDSEAPHPQRAARGSRLVRLFSWTSALLVLGLVVWLGRGEIRTWLDNLRPPPSAGQDPGSATTSRSGTDTLTRRDHRATIDELRQDSMPLVRLGRQWTTMNHRAFRPIGELRLNDLGLAPHPIVKNSPLILLRDNAGEPRTWIGGGLTADDAPFLVTVFDEAQVIVDSSRLIAVGNHPDALVALLTNQDRLDARGLSFRCTITLPSIYPAFLENPAPSSAPAKPGGELKMTRRPTDDLRFATPEAEFRSAVASSEPDEVPAIVWTDAAQSMIALDIEGQRVPLFVRMADTQDVCGQIRMQSRLAHIRHQGEGFRFETRDDFDLGSTHAALGHDGAAFAVEKTP